MMSALMSPRTTISELSCVGLRIAPESYHHDGLQSAASLAGSLRHRPFVVRPRFHEGGSVDSLISVRSDIAAALAANAPVVALESTGIAHGLQRPHNLDTALQMEAAVRAAGAIPATIAVLDGQLVVGLTEEQIALIAEAADVAKASSSDL